VNSHDIHKALQALTPDAEYVLEGETLADIVWLDVLQTQPTDSAILSALATVEQDFADAEYLRLRVLEYQDQGVGPMELALALYAHEFESSSGDAQGLDGIRQAVELQYPDNP